MEENQLNKNMIDEYLLYLKQEEKSKATVEKYGRDLWRFYAYIDEHGEKRKITKEVVISYKEHLMAKYAATSINSILAAVNGFLGFQGWGEFKVKKLRVQRKIFSSETLELSKQEYFLLLEAAREMENERLYLVIQTVCATGIRISELEYFTVEALGADRIEVYCKGKERIIFIPKSLKKSLWRYVRVNGIKSGCIFVTRNGKPLNRSNIWREMKKLCREAQVSEKKVFPHNLRHLFARTYYMVDKDLTKLADVLGHSSVETTRIYVMTTGREHERQLDCLGLIEV